jgi:ubiquinol-cytochrome c reductase iron-sulfur subunit
VPRRADLSEAAAKRAEKQVGGLFTLSILGTVLFVLAYFLVDIAPDGLPAGHRRHDACSTSRSAPRWRSAMLGIGFGAVHWAKTLMPDEEVVEERHPMRASDESRERVVKVLAEVASSPRSPAAP